MMSVNVVLQVRTHCCVLTETCPVKNTVLLKIVHIRYVLQVHNATFWQNLVHADKLQLLMIAVNVVLQIRTQWSVMVGICLPWKITIIAMNVIPKQWCVLIRIVCGEKLQLCCWLSLWMLFNKYTLHKTAFWQELVWRKLH